MTGLGLQLLRMFGTTAYFMAGMVAGVFLVLGVTGARLGAPVQWALMGVFLALLTAGNMALRRVAWFRQATCAFPGAARTRAIPPADGTDAT